MKGNYEEEYSVPFSYCPLIFQEFGEHRTWDRENQLMVPVAVCGCVYFPAVNLWATFVSFLKFNYFYHFNWSIVHLQCVNFRLKGKWFRMHIFFYKFFSITNYYKILTTVSLPFFFSFLILTSENKPTLGPLNLFILTHYYSNHPLHYPRTHTTHLE